MVQLSTREVLKELFYHNDGDHYVLIDKSDGIAQMHTPDGLTPLAEGVFQFLKSNNWIYTTTFDPNYFLTNEGAREYERLTTSDMLTPGMVDILIAMYHGAIAIQWADDKCWLNTADKQWEIPYSVSLRLFPKSTWVEPLSYGVLSQRFGLTSEGRQVAQEALAAQRWVEGGGDE